MHKTVRFAIVFACLVAAVAWGSVSARATVAAPAEALSTSAAFFYQYDVENFLGISGGTGGLLGQVSTVVTYTLGDTVISVEPQIDPNNPRFTDTWVPFGVTNTAGIWSVQVTATDNEGTRVYGPTPLEIRVRPDPVLPLSLPEVILVEASSTAGGALTFDAGDATCNVDQGTAVSLGTITVACTLNGITSTFTAVVTDSTPPVLTIPSDIVTLEHTVTFETSAVDNLDGPIDVHCSPASGETFADGETMVDCLAEDSHGNDAEGSFLVNVGPPVFHLGGDITEEASGPNGNAITYTATVGSGTISCSPASGSTFPITTTPVNCSATNAVGTSTASFNVSVVDTTPPSLVTPGDISADATVTTGVAVNYTTSASDIVSGTVAVTCSTPSGSVFPIGTTQVDCSATDGHSNTTTASFNVTVAYNPPPAPVLNAASGQLWLGPKDNSKKNVTFDILVELLVNGAVIGSGQTNGVGGQPGFGNAVLKSIALTVAGTPIVTGDTVAVRVSARIAANSPQTSGTARLWTNDGGANSRVSVTIQGTTTTYTDYFLRSGGVLGAVGSGPKVPVDVDVDKNVGGNAFKPFGTWTVQY